VKPPFLVLPDTFIFKSVDNEIHLWALNYVYLSRIMVRIMVDHGLRTERHQSPIQIFVQGCLDQQGHRTIAMQEIFGRTA